MSQQQLPNDLYMDYPHPTSRSPNSSRPAYPHSGFPSGFSLPRNTQRPFDSSAGTSPLYPTDRVSPAYGMRGGMDQMSSVQGLPGGYMLDNNQNWAYGANTINGPLNGASRQRSTNRRGALPSVSRPGHF